ncbi:NAD-dependent epimerase/dehydratase family protein [Candidatus Pelagibacter sp. HIMB1746]|uniref:NAD-dependent epimerase/dehydratase family protein n=1 Tax=Candidatus Pelagibacter sp. HIMB1746 TaxID=3413370 RepID=UPI003F83BB15
MKIYITGIAGFLGSHLAKKLIDLGHEVSGNDSMIQGELDNLPKNINFHKSDCCNYEEMSKNLNGVDIVYHCAATAHEGLSVFSPNFITKNIYQASISVITASITNKVKRFVFCSSMARYGKQKSPFTEDMPVKPEDPYGIAKVAVEDTLKLLCEVHSMDYNIAVPHNIVGPNQKYDDPFRNVMSIFINRNLQNKPSIIYGDGNQTRCFSYIDDVIFCLEKLALDKKISKQIINIGPDEETITINELAKLISNETGYNGDPIYVPGRPQEVKEASCSSDKARKLLNYKTNTSLKQSIKLTADYIRSKGTKNFLYNLPVEINSEITPETWTKKTI